jgi:hypothetical protein
MFVEIEILEKLKINTFAIIIPNVLRDHLNSTFVINRV